MATLNMVEFPTLDSLRVDTLRASRRGRRLEAEGYRPVGLTIGRSVSRLFVCLSVCPFVCLSLGLPIRRSACLLVCVFVRVSVCQSVCLCVCLSVCLSVSVLVFAYMSVFVLFPRRVRCVVSCRQHFSAPCRLRRIEYAAFLRAVQAASCRVACVRFLRRVGCVSPCRLRSDSAPCGLRRVV